MGEKPPVLVSPIFLMETPLASYLLSLLWPRSHAHVVERAPALESVPGPDDLCALCEARFSVCDMTVVSAWQGVVRTGNS